MSNDYIQMIESTKTELNKIKDWINHNRTSENVRYLNSYSVIRACGLIEVLYKNMIFDHVTEGVNDEARRYFEIKILDSSSNPKTGIIQSMLNDINTTWAEDFKNRVSVANQEKQALNSLVQLRNDFAHGGNTTATIQTIINYFDGGVTILNILDSIISGETT